MLKRIANRATCELVGHVAFECNPPNAQPPLVFTDTWLRGAKGRWVTFGLCQRCWSLQAVSIANSRPWPETEHERVTRLAHAKPRIVVDIVSPEKNQPGGAA